MLADWVTGSLARPLVEWIAEHILARGEIHANDASIPVLVF